MLKRLFAAPAHSTPGDLALLVLRCVVGLAFMFHGWGKIQHPFSWMGPQGFAHPVFQGLAAISEFGGGLALILGLIVPLALLGICSTMLVALNMHVLMRGDPFVAARGGPSFELASAYLAVALLLLAMGPGRFSLDRLIFGPRPYPR